MQTAPAGGKPIKTGKLAPGPGASFLSIAELNYARRQTHMYDVIVAGAVPPD